MPVPGHTMKRTLIVPMFLAAAALSACVFASPQCTTAPRAQWMTDTAMKQQGYTIKVIKISDNCYEIYGKDKAGSKVKIYFDPIDGRIVKKNGG